MRQLLAISLIAALVISSVSFAFAGPVQQIPLIGGGNGPIYTEDKFTPLVFLNQDGGRVLIDDPYGFMNNGNIETRENNYAFTGEQISWRVLVWDKNGVPEKIEDVFSGWTNQTNGPADPEIQSNCFYSDEQLQDGQNLAQAGYSNVRRPGDQESQISFNDDTMGIYDCVLTIEPTCHGQKWLGVKAVDIDGYSSTMQEAESWFCNPALDLTVSGTIDFGILGPGEQGASTVSVENSAEDGSGTQVVLSISGTDFYDSSSSGGVCPTTNQLSLHGDEDAFTYGFWYSAVQGANIIGNKRIPYGTSFVNSDPVFSQSTSAVDWRDWGGPFVLMSPGAETSLTLHLGLPQPCNGQFDTGRIDLWALAI